jgi:hypothetical protein
MPGFGNGRMRAIRRTVIATALTCVGLFLAPSLAQAANTLNPLTLEPTAPAKGKPFELTATGTAEPNEAPGAAGGYDIYASVYLAAGQSACASTRTLERSNPANLVGFTFSGTNKDLPAGPFEERGQYSSGPGSVDEEAQGYGLKAGFYRACAYLWKSSDSEVVAAERLVFTVGGTCETATSSVAAAEQALAKAKQKLKDAKESGDKKKIKKAKKAVKKAKKKLRIAKEDQAALCI